ncbi:MAG: DNA polymerase III subunit beta [Fusobacterium sp.]|nr:DNA polymerase III subunit beta [Fusobacterium sp.]
MKFSMNRNNFNNIISEYGNILKENPVKPILAGLHISVKNNKVIFKGINTEIELIRYAECISEIDGEVLIRPQLLLEYSKLLETENIYLEKKDGYLVVNDAEFSIFEDSSYPEVIEISALIAAKLNSLKLAKLIEKVKFLSAPANTDMLFNSVKFNLSKDFLELVSTDSYRLIYLKEELSNNLEKDFLIPNETANVIYKILKDFDTDVSIAISDDKLILLWKDAYFSCKLLSLNFPDYKSLFNNFKFDKEFEFNKDELNSALKKVISVTKNSTDTKNVAAFNFKGNHLTISGMSSNAKINQKVNMIKKGEDLKVGINCKYLKDFIDNVDKNIVISALNPTSMFKLKEENNENYIYLVMPVNVRS